MTRRKRKREVTKCLIFVWGYWCLWPPTNYPSRTNCLKMLIKLVNCLRDKFFSHFNTIRQFLLSRHFFSDLPSLLFPTYENPWIPFSIISNWNSTKIRELMATNQFFFLFPYLVIQQFQLTIRIITYKSTSYFNSIVEFIRLM